MTISYDFKVSNNKVINVNFKVKYTHAQTYENRYDPDKYCETELKVKNLNDPSNKIYYQYVENEEITIDEEDDEEGKVHWNFILMKLLDEVIGEEEEWVHIIKSIDSK